MISPEDFQALRLRQIAGEILSTEEEDAVNAYLAQRDAEEMARLAPALARLDAETEAQEERNRQMAELIAQEERLAAYLRRVLDETRHEHDAIREAFRKLVETAA